VREGLGGGLQAGSDTAPGEEGRQGPHREHEGQAERT